MTIQEFIQLDVYEKAETAWGGVYIADRLDQGDIVQLFQLKGFFVEVFFNHFDNEVITVIPFTSSKLLEPYFEEVDISSLVQANY